MDLAAKLQMRAGQSLALLGKPESLTLDLPEAPVVRAAEADAVLAFVISQDDLATVAGPAIEAARADRLAWIAYPKGGRLGTDLNRDRLAAAAQALGVQPVRQVAVDDVWSALRFRPAS